MKRSTPSYFRAASLSLIVVWAALCVGCGDNSYSGPSGKVTGKATLNGNSLPAGTVINFMHKDGHAANGKVGADGTYSLTYLGKPDIPAGEYAASVMEAAAEDPANIDYSDPASMEKTMLASEEGSAGPESAIPAKYVSPASSGLKFTVKEGDNTINVELKSK